MERDAKLFGLRLSLLISWTLVFGLAIVFPRYKTTADLPPIYSDVAKTLDKNKNTYETVIVESRRKLAGLKSAGLIDQSAISEADRVLLEKSKRIRDTQAAMSEADISFHSSDTRADKQALAGMGGGRVVYMDGSSRTQRTVENSSRADAAKASKQVMTLTGLGKIAPRQADEYELLINMWGKQGDTQHLRSLAKCLHDLDNNRSIVPARLRERPKVVIKQLTDRRVTGYLTDFNLTVVAEFSTPRGQAPKVITDELAKWDVAHSTWFSLSSMVILALAIFLIPFERRLAAWEPIAKSAAPTDPFTDYIYATKTHIQSARLRKGLEASEPCPEAINPEKTTFKSWLMSRSGMTCLAFAAALAVIVTIGICTGQTAPDTDPILDKLLAKIVKDGTYVIITP